MIDTDDLSRILVEIETGKPPAIPDTPRLMRLRAQLTLEINEIKAKGGTVDVPHEIP